ncbi:MAG: twin transmembrane helix small protein [Pseudomonadales bacterium]
MFLKTLIIFLLIGVLASLASGLVFLFKDSDKPESRRTLHALGVRITLAIALLATVFYGFYSGQLRMGTHAPWHARTRVEQDRPLPADTNPGETAPRETIP